MPQQQNTPPRRGAALLAAALTLLIPTLAAAQDTPPTLKAAPLDPDAAFAQAVEHFKAQRYQDALNLLDALYKQEPDPVILYNIARCHQELGNLDDAETGFLLALNEPTLPEDLRKQGEEHLANVQQRKEARDATPEPQPQPEPQPDLRLASAYVGGHVGFLVPSLFGELNPAPLFGVEAGYILPFDLGPFTRPLGLALDVLYTAPGAEGDGTHASLGEGGGTYAWELQEQLLIFELTALWRFMPLGDTLSAYLNAGPRLFLLQTTLDAQSDGQSFGQHQERDTNLGAVFGGGLDLQLGPGTAFAALELSWSGLDQKITGDANTGALALDLGYRLHF